MGLIRVDSEEGKKFGFTSNRYNPASYLWERDNQIIVSFIMVKDRGKGHLSELFDKIESNGFSIVVPTPFPLMEKILQKKGFVHGTEQDRIFGEIDVWRKPNSTHNVENRSIK